MPGKKTTRDGKRDRDVTLLVDGLEVELNGYVMDVFQETVLALVRTLGTEDESKSIEVRIAAE